jgi:hypothetical protein
MTDTDVYNTLYTPLRLFSTPRERQFLDDGNPSAATSTILFRLARIARRGDFGRTLVALQMCAAETAARIAGIVAAVSCLRAGQSHADAWQAYEDTLNRCARQAPAVTLAHDCNWSEERVREELPKALAYAANFYTRMREIDDDESIGDDDYQPMVTALTRRMGWSGRELTALRPE